MATAKTKRAKQRRKDRIEVMLFLAVIFFLGFIVGRVTKVTPNETAAIAETATLVEATTVQAEPIKTAEEVKVVEPEETTVYFDCPLSEDLQDYIFILCEEEDIPPSLVIAVIDHESEFESDAISATYDYGLMQINECNHEWLSETYGITDFLDPRQNILAGVKILGQLYRKYDNPHDIAMAYNMGESGAEDAWENGITSTSYSEDVVQKWYMYEVDHEMEVQRQNNGTQTD
jgi:hypothetical protein|nr:MAG TPA: hypothetical protein [Caudoviricetes sp.]